MTFGCMLSIFLMEKRSLNFIIRKNKFLDECFSRWASISWSFLPTNGTNAKTIVLVRAHNIVQNTTQASEIPLLRTRTLQTGVHAIANHVAVVSYWAKLAVDGRCLRQRAFAIR